MNPRTSQIGDNFICEAVINIGQGNSHDWLLEKPMRLCLDRSVEQAGLRIARERCPFGDPPLIRFLDNF